MDEKKTYLINIESNLNKYAEEAVEAKKKVDELKVSNEELKKTGSAAEIEASSAALRQANKEYNNAKRLVDLQTAANNAETGSRKQLDAILKVQMFELGKLGNAYITNANGLRELNPLYVEQRNKIAATKKEIIDYDQALNDGRSNVGRYGASVKEAMGEMGGVFKEVTGAVGGVTGAVGDAVSSFLTAGSAVGVLTAGVALLAKIWKTTQENIELYLKSADKLKYSFAGFEQDSQKALDDYRKRLRGQEAAGRDAEMSARALLINRGHLMNEQEKEGLNIQIQRGEEMKKEARTLLNLLHSDAERGKWKIEYNKLLQEEESLSDEKLAKETEWEKLEAELTKQRAIVSDQESTAAEKKQAGIDADRISKQLLADKTDFLDREIATLNALAEKTGTQEVYEDQINGLLKERNSIQREYYSDQIKINKLTRALFEDIDKLTLENRKNIKKWGEDTWNELVKMEANKSNFKKDLMKLLGVDPHANELQANKELQDQAKKQSKQADEADIKETERKAKLKQDIEVAALNGISAGADAVFTAKRNRLQADMEAELSNANLTEKQKNAIRRKYAKEQQKIDIGQALINGALAVGNALATTKPFMPAGLIAGGLAAVQTAAQVAAIKSQNFSGGGGAPSSISSSAPHITASSVGSTVLTQPQLSQTQLNAIPQQGQLTVEQLTEAFKKLPPPVTTIEDINARTKSTNKIVSRANI